MARVKVQNLFLLSIGNVRFIALVDVDVALAEEMTRDGNDPGASTSRSRYANPTQESVPNPSQPVPGWVTMKI